MPPISAITFRQFSFDPGTEKVTAENDTSLALPPDAYEDVKVKQGARLILSGQQPHSQCVFNMSEMEKGTSLHLDLSRGPIVIEIAENLEFNANVLFEIFSEGDSRGILFRVAGHRVDLKGSSTYEGIFLAPNAGVNLADGALLLGAPYGKKVDIGERVHITGKSAHDLVFAKTYDETFGATNDPVTCRSRRKDDLTVHCFFRRRPLRWS